MEKKSFCPLGMDCEYARDNMLYECMWRVKVIGKHPQTGKDTEEYGCAIPWLVQTQIQVAKTNLGTTDAMCQVRNVLFKAAQRRLPK